MAKRPTIQVSTHGTKPKRNPGDPVTHADVGTGTSVTSLPTAELKARDRNIEAPSRTFQRIITDDDNGGTKPPIPPDQIFHDFSKERLGPFTHTRGSIASGTGRYPDERNIINSSNTPIYTGDRLNPPSTWFDEMLCYGIQVEPYSENRLKYSNDLANAVWAKANTSASSEGLVTASADNATISQAFDLGSATPGVFSGYATSVTAATSIEVSSDGTNWTSITLSGQTRFALPTSTQTGTCWVRLQTSGDQVKINWVQLEPSPNGQPTSWIPTYATAPIGRGRTVVETPGTGDGAANGFSLQVTATALGDSSKHPDATAPFFSVISTDYSCRLTAYHDTVGGTVNLTWENNAAPETLTGPAFTSVLNDAIDIKLRKSADEGLVLSVNGTKASFPTYTDFFAQPLKRLRVGSDLNDTALHEFQWIRFDPTGVSQVEVDTWPVWTQPLPIIEDPQPQSIQFPVEQPPTVSGYPIVTGIVQVGEQLRCTDDEVIDTAGKQPPYSYDWIVNDASTGVTLSTFTPSTSHEGGYVRCDFYYENSDNTPRGPISSLARGPIAAESVTLPPATGPVATLNAKNSVAYGNWAMVDEGGTAKWWTDIKNLEEITWYITQPPIRNYDRAAAKLPTVWTEMPNPNAIWPGAYFATEQIPEGRDIGYENKGYSNDTSGMRYALYIPNMALGSDASIKVSYSGGGSSGSTGFGKASRMQVRKKAIWKTLADSPSLYAVWSIEDPEPELMEDFSPDITQTNRRQYNTERLLYHRSDVLDMDNTTANGGPYWYVNSVSPCYGSGGDLLPVGPPPGQTSGWHCDNGYFLSNKKAAYNRGTHGFRHDYSGTQAVSDGLTVMLSVYKWDVTHAGTLLQLLDDGGAEYLALFMNGTDNRIRLRLKSTEYDTGLVLQVCEASLLAVSFDEGSVGIWSQAIHDHGAVPYYTRAGGGAANIKTITFSANHDATAPEDGLFSLACVNHQKFDDSVMQQVGWAWYVYNYYHGAAKIGNKEGY